MLKKIVLLFCFLVSGCVSQDTIEVTKEQRVITTNNKPAIVTKDPEVSTTDEVTQDESAVSDNQEPAVNRPVITLKYDKVMIDEGYSIPNPSYNIALITDVEDGELTESDVWYGGLTAGPIAEAYFRTLHEPYDHCEFVSPGRKMIIPGGVEKITIDGYNAMLERIIAYDSDGYVSWADYYILEIPDTGETATGSCIVNVEGLRIRTAPSTSSEQVAYAWSGASYETYETSEAEGYTWYRIGKDLWIADNGEWLTIK